MERRVCGATIERFDPHADVFRPGLGIFDEHIEVAIIVEHTRVQQLELRHLATGPRAVLLDQSAIRKLRLRILVQILHVRVRRRRVEIVVELLHVLAVVSFLTGEAEQALLEDRIALVPERHREAEMLAPVGDSRDAVLVPAIRARARVVVRDVVPRRAARAVVLADGAPRALAQVRAPALPVGRAIARLGKPLLFAGSHGPPSVRLRSGSVTRRQAATRARRDRGRAGRARILALRRRARRRQARRTRRAGRAGRRRLRRGRR